MKYFVKIDGARFVSYEGMTQEAIDAMLTDQNLAYEFVNELAYQEALESLDPKIN
jgi:hypothetical protein